MSYNAYDITEQDNFQKNKRRNRWIECCMKLSINLVAFLILVETLILQFNLLIDLFECLIRSVSVGLIGAVLLEMQTSNDD